jgi:peptide/nickel transport system permease protein
MKEVTNASGGQDEQKGPVRLSWSGRRYGLGLVKSKINTFTSWIRWNPTRSCGAALLLILMLIAIFAPYIAPYDPMKTGTPFLEPSSDHLLGTDDLGRDIFSQVVYGTRISLVIGLLASAISIVIGVSIGLFAGYYRGVTEEVLMGITDVYILIPGLPLMILLASYLTPSIWTIIFVIGILWWCSTARIVHSRVLQVREMQYIESTKTLGYSGPYIILKHVLANTKDVIFAKYSLAVGSAMMTEASLSFIGLGDPSNISWGEIASMAYSRGGFSGDMWWWYLAPGVMIGISVLAFLLLATHNETEDDALEMLR